MTTFGFPGVRAIKRLNVALQPLKATAELFRARREDGTFGVWMTNIHAPDSVTVHQIQAVFDTFDDSAPDAESAEIQAARAFLLNDSPNSAQIIAAVKALIRHSLRNE